MNNLPSQQTEYRLSNGLKYWGLFQEQTLKIQPTSKRSAQHQCLIWHNLSSLSLDGDKCSMRMKKQSQNPSTCSSVWSLAMTMGDTVRHSCFSKPCTLIYLIPFRLVCGSRHSQGPRVHFFHQMVPPIPLLASHFYHQLQHPLKGALQSLFSSYLNFLFAFDLPWFTDSSILCSFEVRQNS